MELNEFKAWIRNEVESYLERDEGNRLSRLDGSPIFQNPLIGFVSGSDSIFPRLKGVIGDFHLTPQEVMEYGAKERGVPIPDKMEVGVISYVLPISTETKDENADIDKRPSERWSHTRLFGEEFNKKLSTHLVSLLEDQGYLAVAPETVDELFATFDEERVGKTSNWSQRHIAYAAGLGTFGLSDGLITARGKAHRAGSVVVGYPLDSPSERKGLHDYCLFYRDKSCMACAKRCPVGAITEEGHNKERCAKFVFGQEDFVNENYGIDIYGCGLCQTGVPCGSEIPESVD